MKQSEIAAVLGSQTWAIHRPALERMAVRLSEDAEFAIGDLFADAPVGPVSEMYAARSTGNRTGTVAIVPVLGPITKRDTFMTLFFGGTSVNSLIAQLRQLSADETVASILLNIDSPGGTVSGLPELAAEIANVRAGGTAVYAIANDFCASAAYFIASQAEEIAATPEAIVGSIGTLMMHTDWSRAMDEAGIKVTYIHAGERKVDGNPYEPLSDRAKGEMQDLVDDAYRQFVAAVSSGRAVPAATVRSPEWGEGAVFTAKVAKGIGMIDRIGTYTETVTRLSGARPPVPGARAGGDQPEIEANADEAERELAAAMAERDEHANTEAEFNAKLAATRNRTARWRAMTL